MTENSILIEGKEYISSDRAAKLVGYTKDYVGQLARAGKIKSKRIGRSWYIEEESINKHKLSVHYILTKPKKSFNTVDKVSENTNKNKDISSNHYSNEVSNVRTDYKKNDENCDKNIEPSFEEKHDLLPKLRQKTNDALLHADIRYEKVVAPEAVYATQEHKKQNAIHHEAYKEVSIRTAIQKRNSHSISNIAIQPHKPNTLSSPVSGGMPRIDGIITPSKRKLQYQSIQKPRIQKQVAPVEYTVPQRAVSERRQSKHDEEPSKIIPVIGGIVLFTIFVVVYILFSLA